MEIENGRPLRLAPDEIRRSPPPPHAGKENRAADAQPFSSPVYGGGAERALASEAKGVRIVAIARRWIGTPYVHQASVKGVGCDCLGLLRGVWRELCGEEPEDVPPYSPDWAEATGAETLYMALSRHLTEVALPPRKTGSSPLFGRETEGALRPGDIALFRMVPRGPAKHCGIVASEFLPPFTGGVARSAEGGGRLTLIHARQNKRVSEEVFSQFWQRKLAFVFRLLLDRPNNGWDF